MTTLPQPRNATVGYVKDAVAAILACLVLFGLPLNEQQLASILLVVTAVGTLVLALNDMRIKKTETPSP